MRKLRLPHRTLLLAFVVPFALVLFLTAAPPASAATQVEPPLTIVKPLTISSLSPAAGKLVTAEFAIRNDGANPMYLYHLGAAGRAPGCVDFNCPRVENFEIAEGVTLAPGQTYDYKEQRTFTVEGAYFFQLTYEVVVQQWSFVGDRIDVTVQPGLRLTQPLAVTPVHPAKNQQVPAQFEIANAGTEPITLGRLVVGARGPDCVPATWDCTRRPDYSFVNDLTLAPGESYEYSATRSFTENGRYWVQVSFIDEAGEWQQIGERIDFLVSDIGGVGIENLFLPLVQP
jgi:hypothetical protein